MIKWTYDNWVHRQAARIIGEMRVAAMAGLFDLAIYVVPGKGAAEGQLILAHEKPDGATDVLSFPGVGTRISAIAYGNMSNAIWNACRRMPICPTA